MAPADAGIRVRNLLEALGEPALIVRAGNVMMANGPAHSLLGERIEGQDVRLAIRHPAAVERLLRSASGRAEEIELIGIGEAERRWTMAMTPLGHDALFVRLTDRSEVHAAERMRVDFVANASHELRTPLASLSGFIDTLQGPARNDLAARERFLELLNEQTFAADF